MSKRFTVIESFGYGHRQGIRINESTAPRELAASTVRSLIRELRGWANGYADHVSEVDSAGSRLLTGHHWINGFENIRQLRITEVHAMTVQLSIHEIGRASDPAATQTTAHESAEHALAYLSQRFGAEHIRGGITGGTIGGLNGRVFQASRTWVIRQS